MNVGDLARRIDVEQGLGSIIRGGCCAVGVSVADGRDLGVSLDIAKKQTQEQNYCRETLHFQGFHGHPPGRLSPSCNSAFIIAITNKSRFVASRSLMTSDALAVRLLLVHASKRPPSYGVTVNFPPLVAVPPRVVIVMFPVTAPVGTVAVTCVSEFTTKLALTPPNVT